MSLANNPALQFKMYHTYYEEGVSHGCVQFLRDIATAPRAQLFVRLRAKLDIGDVTGAYLILREFVSDDDVANIQSRATKKPLFLLPNSSIPVLESLPLYKSLRDAHDFLIRNDGLKLPVLALYDPLWRPGGRCQHLYPPLNTQHSNIFVIIFHLCLSYNKSQLFNNPLVMRAFYGFVHGPPPFGFPGDEAPQEFYRHVIELPPVLRGWVSNKVNDDRRGVLQDVSISNKPRLTCRSPQPGWRTTTTPSPPSLQACLPIERVLQAVSWLGGK